MEVYSPPIARESKKRDFRNIWNVISGKAPQTQRDDPFYYRLGEQPRKSRHRFWTRSSKPPSTSPVKLLLRSSRNRMHRNRQEYYIATDTKSKRQLARAQKKRKIRDRKMRKRREEDINIHNPTALGYPGGQAGAGTSSRRHRRRIVRRSSRTPSPAANIDGITSDIEKTISTASYIQSKRRSFNPVTRLRARILERYMVRKRNMAVALLKAPIEMVIGKNERVSSAVRLAVDLAQAPIWWYFGGGRRGLKNLRQGRIFGTGEDYMFDFPLLNSRRRLGVDFGTDERRDRRRTRRRGALGAARSVVKLAGRGVGGRIFKQKKVQPKRRVAVYAEW